MKNHINWKLLISCFIILIFVFVGIQRYISQRDLKKNGTIVYATIQDVLPSGKATASPSFKCRFFFKGKEKVLISSSSIKGNIFSYLGKSFPALYSSKTNSLRLLMTKDDYLEFGIDYPDSLKYR